MRCPRWSVWASGIACGLLAGGCSFFPGMRNQPSIKPYERDMPAMPAHVVPTTGGDVLPDEAAARELPNPVPSSEPAATVGQTYYGYYCQHCHGPDGNARTPVGESYMPQPTPLTSRQVQEATDGELYRGMVLGPGHEPVLKTTVPPERRWYIIHFIRTLAE